MSLSRWCFVAVLALAAVSARADDKPKKLLLVTHSGGFIHDSVGLAEDVLKEIGPKHGYEVTCFRFTNDPTAMVKYKPEKDQPEKDVPALEKYSAEFRKRTGKMVEAENCGRINIETLAKFDAVLFFTTGNPMTKEETQDLVAWVKSGGAFAGTHCASDTLYGEPAYGDLIGGYFAGHPSGLQNIKIKVEDPAHPAAAGFADGAAYKDEMYIFRAAPYSRDRLHIIYSVGSVDTFEPKLVNKNDPKRSLTRPDADYAISWCREEGKGKVFYTSFGHDKKVWQDAGGFQKHLLGGLDWAVGRKAGSAAPSGKK